MQINSTAHSAGIDPLTSFYWELESLKNMVKAAKASIRYQKAVLTDDFIIKAQISRFKTEIGAQIDNLCKKQFYCSSEQANHLNSFKKQLQTL